MRYFKDNNNEVFGYEETQIPKDGLVEITLDEVNAIKKSLITLDEAKESQSFKIKQDCTANDPVSLSVTFKDATTKNITFNGGDSSAAAISGAIELATALGETEVALWDSNNIVHTGISFDEALSISVSIAKKYRDDMIKRQGLLNQIDAATTKEELELITWN